jgi:signal transduction histidine kinase
LNGPEEDGASLELSEENESEKTIVIRGPSDIMQDVLSGFHKVKERLDNCIDSTGPASFIEVGWMRDHLWQLGKKGVKMRIITEITIDNIAYCKELIKIAEVRHLNGIKGNFGIVDGAIYRASAQVQEGKPPTELIKSSSRAFVDQQQFFFETLWNKATPAEQKIREIEEGQPAAVIETITDPLKIQKLGHDLVKAASNEVLVIFSTTNAFLRQEKVGLSSLISQAIRANPFLRIKIMLPYPSDDETRKLAAKLRDEGYEASLQKGEQRPVDIRYIEEPLQTKISLLIVDRTYSLAVELKDDSKTSSIDAMGLATYSNSKATVLSYVSIFESLWNQSELYMHISSLYEQLKVHDKMQSEFINIAAHELRNPIQPILGLAEILREQSKDNPEQVKLLDAIIRSAERLKHLQEDILDVTRIECDMLQLDLTSFSLEGLILETLRDLETRLESETTYSNVDLAYKGNLGKDHLVKADKGRIIQVMSNLLDNALKFTKEGKIIVDTRQDDAKQSIIVSVTDEGPGIDNEVFPKLFTRFASKSRKGTGLGLYISKGIVEAHGGSIWAKNNEEGSGATFSFSIPLEKMAR